MSTTMNRELTIGEARVGISFNPGNNPEVDKVKAMAAELITTIDQIKNSTTNGEAIRCLAVAMTEIEGAAMWAVKGIIKK